MTSKKYFCRRSISGIFLIWLGLAIPNSVLAGTSSSFDSPKIVSVRGAETRDRQSGLSAGKALAHVLAGIGRGSQGVTVQIEGYFVLENPLDICDYTGLSMISPSKTAILAAASRNVARGIFACRTDRLLLDGFQMDGFGTDGVFAQNTKSTEIRNITVLNTRSRGWSQAAIHLTGNSTGAYLHNNSVRYADYAGILIDTNAGSDVSNVQIKYNKVLDVCRVIDDCGAIYINDRGRRSKKITIEANRIMNFGSSSGGGRGIYLDDWASNVIVRGNTLLGSGGYAFQIHGGHDNVIRNNFIDARQIGTIMLYHPPLNGNRSDMANNAFFGNTVRYDQTNGAIIHEVDRSGAGGLNVSDNKACQGSTCRSSQ